jgi:hypothetical protein
MHNYKPLDEIIAFLDSTISPQDKKGSSQRFQEFSEELLRIFLEYTLNTCHENAGEHLADYLAINFKTVPLYMLGTKSNWDLDISAERAFKTHSEIQWKIAAKVKIKEVCAKYIKKGEDATKMAQKIYGIFTEGFNESTLSRLGKDFYQKRITSIMENNSTNTVKSFQMESLQMEIKHIIAAWKAAYLKNPIVAKIDNKNPLVIYKEDLSVGGISNEKLESFFVANINVVSEILLPLGEIFEINLGAQAISTCGRYSATLRLLSFLFLIVAIFIFFGRTSDRVIFAIFSIIYFFVELMVINFKDRSIFPLEHMIYNDHLNYKKLPLLTLQEVKDIFSALKEKEEAKESKEAKVPVQKNDQPQLSVLPVQAPMQQPYFDGRFNNSVPKNPFFVKGSGTAQPSPKHTPMAQKTENTISWRLPDGEVVNYNAYVVSNNGIRAIPFYAKNNTAKPLGFILWDIKKIEGMFKHFPQIFERFNRYIENCNILGLVSPQNEQGIKQLAPNRFELKLIAAKISHSRIIFSAPLIDQNSQYSLYQPIETKNK